MGSGRTTTLLQTIAYCQASDWAVLYIPNGVPGSHLPSQFTTNCADCHSLVGNSQLTRSLTAPTLTRPTKRIPRSLIRLHSHRLSSRTSSRANLGFARVVLQRSRSSSWREQQRIRAWLLLPWKVSSLSLGQRESTTFADPSNRADPDECVPTFPPGAFCWPSTERKPSTERQPSSMPKRGPSTQTSSRSQGCFKISSREGRVFRTERSLPRRTSREILPRRGRRRSSRSK